VRYQVASWKRSARACSTPAVSAPASGCPPTKRGSSIASTTLRFVEPASVTTHSSGAAASTSRTTSGSTPTGAHTNTASASRTASASDSPARSIAPSSSARSSVERLRLQPLTTAPPSRPCAASPIDPPIRPTPTIARRTGALARRNRGQDLAGDVRRRFDLRRVGREVGRDELLRAVADRLVRSRVDLDDDPVGTDGGRRER